MLLAKPLVLCRRHLLSAKVEASLWEMLGAVKMKPNEKLSRMLHILIHIHLHQGAATSETIAQMLGTNAVVVRRMMAGLRNLGYVQATNGRGGGWQMRRELSTLSVLDIYHALGEPELLAMGTSKDHPDCPVEQSVSFFLEPVLKDAEQSILKQYAGITLLQLAEQSRLFSG